MSKRSMFFKALNPSSKKSGISYSLAYGYHCYGKEMQDQTLDDHFSNYKKIMTFAQRIDATFELLVGAHYDFDLKGKIDCKGGKKGILDWLIFPLLARKLIADCDLPHRKKAHVINFLAYLIALPLEFVRFTLGIFITALLILPIFIIHAVKLCIGSETVLDNSHSYR